MQTNDLINHIQKEINAIRSTRDHLDWDDWVDHHLNRMQWAINDYRNRDFKATEPDPFN